MTHLEKKPKDFPTGLLTPVGSRVTCTDTPREDSDYDFLGFYSSNAVKWLVENGYALEGQEQYAEMPDFESWRKDDINIILAKTIEFYDKFILATFVVTQLNVAEREKRITVFQAILYGVRY